MADEEKEGGGGGGGSGFTDTLFWLLFVLVAGGVLTAFLDRIGFSFESVPTASGIISWFLNTFQTISIFFSFVFLVGIIYTNFKMGELLGGHGHGHGSHDGGVAHSHGHDHKPAHIVPRAPNKRWQSVLQRVASSNEADWRLAIIECDIILDEMLTKMGYMGEGVADKLKQVEPADFNTLEDAWAAHKIRNAIAHQGLGHSLTKSEATRAVQLYEKVFREFYFI